MTTVLLFLLFRRMTGDDRPSAFVAALFAVHPLHVESVAWIAERKDVLSTLFWVLDGLGLRASTCARSGLAALPRRRRRCSALALMAKPMVVTLPVVLLLLDIWPLGRLRLSGAGRSPGGALLLEKVPLLALALVTSVATITVQHRVGAMARLRRAALAPARLQRDRRLRRVSGKASGR